MRAWRPLLLAVMVLTSIPLFVSNNPFSRMSGASAGNGLFTVSHKNSIDTRPIILGAEQRLIGPKKLNQHPLPQQPAPLVRVIVLDREKNSPHVKRTFAALTSNGYNFSTFSAYDARNDRDLSIIPQELARFGATYNTNLEHTSSAGAAALTGALVGWWDATSPVISLQSDTIALRPWDIPREVYAGYDLVCLHHRVYPQPDGNEYPNCDPDTTEAHMLEGPQHCFGFNAIMYTARDPALFRRVLNGSKLPNDDHWYDTPVAAGGASVGKLKVGSVCPPIFDARDSSHGSTIVSGQNYF